MTQSLDRRRWLQGALSAAPVLAVAGCSRETGDSDSSLVKESGGSGRIRVAVLTTVFRYRCHAHVILENFLVPYLFNGGTIDPTTEFEIASLYVDQFPENDAEFPDMARDVAKQFGIPIFDSIAGALTLGGKALATDAVLLIAEHGEYPLNEKGQELYPKKRFFDEMVAVFESSGRSVPVYFDKHLSHDWSEALAMVETSRRLGFGLMAGSSVPFAQRIPPLQLDSDRLFRTAVSIHGGPMERFGFHALEILQSMIESRPGGETGIRSVQTFAGDAFWKANAAGVWNAALVQATLAAEFGDAVPPLAELAEPAGPDEESAHGILINYRDGLSAAVLKLGASGIRWNFGCWPIAEKNPVATRFHVGPWNNRNLFKAHAHAIQHLFRTGLSPSPVGRTLLVSGALEAALVSHHQGGRSIETPHLDFSYSSTDFTAFREMGKSWEIITDDTPQPRGIEPVGV